MPLGKPAVASLRAYLSDSRGRLVRADPDCPWVFISRGGRGLDAGNALDPGQEVRSPGRPQPQGQPAYAAAQFRHSSCWPAARTCAPCRNCWAMPIFARRNTTPTWTGTACGPFIANSTPADEKPGRAKPNVLSQGNSELHQGNHLEWRLLGFSLEGAFNPALLHDFFQIDADFVDGLERLSQQLVAGQLCVGLAAGSRELSFSRPPRFSSSTMV